jgi:hypothetical protein
VTGSNTIRAEPGGSAQVAARAASEVEPDDEEVYGPDGDEVAAATRPRGAVYYQPWWKIWLPIPLIFLVLDLTFNLYFWHIPKLTGTADDYSYQFLYDLHDLQTHRPPGVRILAFGSSVTSAFDPFQIDGLLDRDLPGEAIEVRRILRPGSKPSDYRLLWDSQLDPIEPDVMVSVFNLVDFINPSFERSLKPGIRYILPPWETLLARYEYIPRFSEKLEMLLASVSNLYRYRKPIRSTIRDHVKLIRSWWRGAAPGPYGIYPDGYSKPRFGVPAAAKLELMIDPAWIQQRGRARVVFELDGVVVGRIDTTESGWRSVELDLPENASGIVDGTVEGGWTPRASGRGGDVRLLGVRLRPPPAGVELARKRPPLRYPPVLPSDIKPLLRMGGARGADYAAKWRATLEEPSDFGKRFRLYRDAKLERAHQTFEPDREFAELAAMVRAIAAKGIRVVMVNTPENPLLEGVVDSPFYRDYLAFLRSIAAGDERITLVDLHEALPPEDLNDWHHLNYVGQMKIGQELAQDLRPVVEEVLQEKRGTT